jgi:hypothetical protein
VIFHFDRGVTAKVAGDAGDGVDVDDGAAMDLPEDISVEFIEQLAQWFANQRFIGRGDDAGVFLVRVEKQYVFHVDELQCGA